MPSNLWGNYYTKNVKTRIFGEGESEPPPAKPSLSVQKLIKQDVVLSRMFPGSSYPKWLLELDQELKRTKVSGKTVKGCIIRADKDACLHIFLKLAREMTSDKRADLFRRYALGLVSIRDEPPFGASEDTA